jgi:hypothetical protein
VRSLCYASVTALVTDVHGVVRVVRTTELVWSAFVRPDGERVRPCGEASRGTNRSVRHLSYP